MTVNTEFPYRLYLVIAEADCGKRNFLEVAELAIRGGVDIIQLREKGCATAAFTDKAKRLKDITDRYNIPLVINDDLEVAMRVDAAGIHVGNNDIAPILVRERWKNKDKMVGYSIEYPEQLSNPQCHAADYLGISPVFSTRTKTDTVTEWGLEGISAIRRLTTKPLVAIGNMHPGNAKAVIKAGADCIAVVSAICSASDPLKAAFELKNEIIK